MTARRAERLPVQPWMVEEATKRVLRALDAAGIEARFVGGAVRDALLGLPVGDIDLATPAPPEDVMELLRKEGIKVVPTGLAHGTITVVVPPRHFELTTLRRDVETFGRHARVAFDADWAADAARRDFTMNAIFLSPDGQIFDPEGGLPDLRSRRVRFVGDPNKRIAEDVLRLLRYYRFEARFGEGTGDAAARAACRAAKGLLPRLSAERVAQELLRLLAAPNPIPALAMMREDSVLAAVLPEARGLARLERLIAIAPESDALLRLAALVEVDPEEAEALARRLHFSRRQRERLSGLVSSSLLEPEAGERAQRRVLYRLGAERFGDLALLLAASGRLESGRLAELLALARRWKPPLFPIAGRDVRALGIAQGERVGRLLGAVKEWWEKGDFRADRALCLARLKELIAAESER
jgi:poly(A) polymerase